MWLVSVPWDATNGNFLLNLMLFLCKWISIIAKELLHQCSQIWYNFQGNVISHIFKSHSKNVNWIDIFIWKANEVCCSSIFTALSNVITSVFVIESLTSLLNLALSHGNPLLIRSKINHSTSRSQKSKFIRSSLFY